MKNNLNTMQLVKIYWQKKWQITGITGFVSIVAIVISLMLPKYYISSATIVANESNSSMSSMMGLASQFGLGGMMGGTGDQVNRYLAILKSSSIKKKAISKFNLMEEYESKTLVDAMTEFSGNYNVMLDEEMQVSFSFVDKSPETSAEVSNYILFCLDSINQTLGNTTGRNKRIFVKKQYDEIMDSLNNLEYRLTRLMEEDNLIILPDQLSISAQQAALLKSEILMKEVERDVLLATLDKEAPLVRQIDIELKGLKEQYQLF